MIKNYLHNYAYKKAPLFCEPTAENLKTVVVIPCFNEPQALTTLESLHKNTPTHYPCEIILIINQSENCSKQADRQNTQTFKQATAFSKNYSTPQLKFLVHFEKNIPQKQAGVGLARKIGMDEAVRRLNHPNGIIVCLDADCTVSENYLQEIENNFSTHSPNYSTIYFEHPISGTQFSPEIYTAIYNYELHLRYYKHALQHINYPLAFYTVGSSMAVTVGTYCKQGGMNKRKAGEDFYFLQKLTKLSQPLNITSCTVYPSPRISHRVPFGTGKAVNDILKTHTQTFLTYNYQSFIDLQQLFEQLPSLHENKQITLPESVKNFLSTINFFTEIQNIKQHTTNFPSFQKQFYQWFNMFKVLKFIHFARDNYYPDQPLQKAVKQLIETAYQTKETTDYLTFLREQDKIKNK